MRDVNIGRVRGNVSITDGSGGGGGGFETIAMAVVALFVVVVVLQIAAAVAHAIAAAVLIICLVILSAIGLAITGAIGWVVYCLASGRPIRSQRQPRQLPVRRVQAHQITDARPSQLPANLHPDDLERIAASLARRLGGGHQ